MIHDLFYGSISLVLKLWSNIDTPVAMDLPGVQQFYISGIFCSKELQWMLRPDHGQGDGHAGRAGLSGEENYDQLSPSKRQNCRTSDLPT